MNAKWMIFQLVLLSIIFVTACATTPTGRSQLAFMPDNEVDAMGLQAFDNLKNEKAISSNEREIQFVQCIADAITRE
nr:M48 family peptidase [Betaproteobacteria bacterium]